MININDLVLLEKEEEAKQALIMAIRNQFQLYIINRNSSPRVLTSGELDEIRSAVPNLVDIALEHHSSGINPLKRVSYLDLWMEKAKYEEFFSEKLSVASEAARAYLTPHLILMYKAIEEFWLNADLTYLY